MNILNMLNRSGKMALSALQAVGLTAVVGVAGVAAWQYLGSPEEDNTAFNPAQYNPGEVVYVAGANTGGYGSNSYSGVGGEQNSSVRVSAKNLQRIDNRVRAEQAALEMEEEAAMMQTQQASAAPAPGPAYQMGGTEGFGMGANAANELDLKNNPMAAMSQSMEGIKNMVANAQQQAQQQAAAQEAPAGAAPAALASARPNWAGKAGSGGSNGFNASFAVQDSGKNAGGAAKGASGAMQGADAIAAAQAQAARMLEGGSRIRGRASFGNANGGLTGGRDASIMGGSQGDKDRNDLEFIRKRSADAAANRHRASNEGARAFLASTQVSGGMRIAADNVTTGQGQGSRDMNGDYTANLRGIQRWATGETTKQNTRDEDRNALEKWLWWAIGLGAVTIIAIPLLRKIPVWGVWAAGVLTAIAGVVVAMAGLKAAEYAHVWGGDTISKTTGWVAIAMAAGIAASWIFTNHIQKFYDKIWKILGVAKDSVSSGISSMRSGGIKSFFKKIISLFKNKPM